MTNIMEYTDPLLDDAIIIDCGIEHPRREGNLCIKPLDHEDNQHEDADGNVWSGQNWVND